MPSPAHEAYVASLPPGGATPEVRPSPQEFVAMRAMEAATPVVTPPGAVVTPVEAGGVPALWVQAAGALPKRTILYLHGGGYIFLTAGRFTPVMAEIAKSADARCLGIDYRRAPEHPFPAPVDDAVAAYRWLLDQGTAPATIALAGDSAGGGLVIAALLAIRDAGLPTPAAGASVSPWTDLRVEGGSAQAADDPVVTGKALKMMADTYLAGADPAHAYASPLYADLAGLPPLHVQVGTREALLDDARRFVARAREQGVDVTSLEHPDVAHMWIFYDVQMPEAQAAFQAIGEFVKAKIPA
jgi:monoterpene epsilon-lactone hydrolase